MATPQYAYEFDPYGDNPNNRITGERHTITPANGKDFNYYIPAFAPFHRRNFVMRAVTNGVVGGQLTATKDYYFGFRYDQMILSGAMEPIYGAIVLNDPQFGGDVSIDYNTVGGEYVMSTAQIATILANNLIDPRTIQWSAVADVPDQVPAVPHKHDAMVTLVGLDSVVDSLYAVIDAISGGFNKAFQALQEHLRDQNNPHHVTAQQVGVDGNGTLVPASQLEAEAGTDNNKYMTSLRVMQSIQKNALPVIAAHAARIDNPHAVTASQVGLGNVANYSPASATESEAGVATNRYMTPANVLSAMTYRVPLLMQSHTTNYNNPHQVTKAQVGLSNVPNYPLATPAQAVSGTDNTTFMTPYLVAQAVATGSSQGLAAHLLNYSNPHQVTAAQVGLGSVQNYPLATVAQAQAGTDRTTYMTPYLVSQMLATSIGGNIDAHIANLNNPHQTTAAQVGLGNVPNYAKSTMAQALAGSDDASLMTPYLVAQAITVGTPQALSSHMVDYSNPHRVTAAQVGLSNVANYPMANDSDMVALTNANAMVSPKNLGFLLSDGIGQQIETALGKMGNVTPIFSGSAGLFATISARYPYEYTFLKPEFDNGVWIGDANGYYPKFNPTVFSGVYQAVTDDITPDGGFAGVVDRGVATMLGWILGEVELSNGAGYIILRAAGTKLDLVLHTVATRTYTVLTSFPAVTMSSIISTGGAWSFNPIWTDGEFSSIVCSVNGSAFTITIATIAAEASLDGTVINPVIGFGLTSATNATRFRVESWMENGLYYRDMSAVNTCYQYTAGAWAAVDISVLAANVIPGAWYHNRFSGETWGSLTPVDMVLTGRKKLVSSTDITVTETPTGYQLTLAGPVATTLSMGTNDITFTM